MWTRTPVHASCLGWCRTHAQPAEPSSSRDPSVQIAGPCYSLAILVAAASDVLDGDFAKKVVSGGHQVGCFYWAWRASLCPEGPFQLLCKCVSSGLRSEVADRRPASAMGAPVLDDFSNRWSIWPAC